MLWPFTVPNFIQVICCSRLFTVSTCIQVICCSRLSICTQVMSCPRLSALHLPEQRSAITPNHRENKNPAKQIKIRIDSLCGFEVILETREPEEGPLRTFLRVPNFSFISQCLSQATPSLTLKKCIFWEHKKKLLSTGPLQDPMLELLPQRGALDPHPVLLRTPP